MQDQILTRKAVSFLFLMLIVTGNVEIFSQRLSRDLYVDLLLNQAGYLPNASKTCVTRGIEIRTFNVINILSQQVVLSGILQPESGDFGTWLSGDFSAVTTEGHYYLKSDTLRSYPFVISGSAYQSP